MLSTAESPGRALDHAHLSRAGLPAYLPHLLARRRRLLHQRSLLRRLSTSPFDPGTNVELSTGGGTDWQAVPSGSGSIRNDLACPAAQACYTVGDHGTITRSANGTAVVADRGPAAANL